MVAIFERDATDFSTNGLGPLAPQSCEVTETLNGMYQVTMVHPLDPEGKWTRIERGRIIRVPVPAAATPEIKINESTSNTRTLYKVETSSGSRLHLRSKASTSSKVLTRMSQGSVVTLIDAANTQWYRVSYNGTTGYAYASYLEFYKTETITVPGSGKDIQPKQVRDQPFRIHQIVPGIGFLTVYARHLFYDLSDNLILEYKPKDALGTTVLSGILSNSDQAHSFVGYSDITDTGTAEWLHVTPVEALLGDAGYTETWHGELMRDWYDIFLVKRLGMNRGVYIRYGKNLLGISGTIDNSNVVTHLLPVGQTKDGKPLYLPDNKYVDSTHINDYVHPIYGVLNVADARESSDLNKAACYELMRKAAQNEYDNGADLPDASFEIDFLDLRQTVEYQGMESLEDVYLGDTVTVIYQPMAINLAMRVVEYIFDCLTNRYITVTLGSASASIASSSISAKQLPNGKINGNKLAFGSVGAGQVRDGAVSTTHIQNAAITQALIADAAIGNAQIGLLAVDTANIKDAAIKAAQIDFAQIALANILVAYINSANIKELDAEKIKTGTLSVQRLELVGSETSILFTINDFNGATMPSSVKWQGVSIAENTLTIDHIVPNFGMDLDLSNNDTVVSLKNDSATITSELIKFRAANMVWQFLDPNDLQKVVMELKADGVAGFDEINAKLIKSDSIVSVANLAALMAENPAATPKQLIEGIGRYIKGTQTLTMTANYAGNLLIEGLLGGTLVIDMNTKKIDGTIVIRNCSFIILKNGTLVDDRTGSLATWGYTLVASQGSNVQFDNLIVDTKNARSVCILIASGAKAYILNCDVTRANVGIYSDTGADVSVKTCKGNVAEYGVLATMGGLAKIGGTIPIGGIANSYASTGNAGVVLGTASGSPTIQDGTPPATPITTSFVATQIARWNIDSTPSWRDVGTKYYQGRYDAAAGHNIGCIWPDLTAMRAAIGTKTIVSATITMRRYRGAGSSNAKPVFMFGLKNIQNTSGAGPSVANDIGTDYGSITIEGKTAKSIGSWEWPTAGESKTVSIPNQAIVDLLAVNNVYGLCIYDGIDEDNYMYFDTKPTLTVTYQ